MEIKSITGAEFAEATSQGKAVAVFTGAGYLSAIIAEETINELVEKHQGSIAFYKVDIDQEPELMETYDIISVPTLIAFSDGDEVSRKTGFMPSEGYDSLIDELND